MSEQARALGERFAQYQRDERGRNQAEVVYWRQQYKQLAADAIAALASHPGVAHEPMKDTQIDGLCARISGEWSLHGAVPRALVRAVEAHHGITPPSTPTKEGEAPLPLRNGGTINPSEPWPMPDRGAV